MAVKNKAPMPVGKKAPMPAVKGALVKQAKGSAVKTHTLQTPTHTIKVHVTARKAAPKKGG